MGINFNIASGFVTISGTPTASITTQLYIAIAVTTTGSCSNSSLLGTITVDPDDDLDLLSAVGTDAQVLCETEPITDIVYQFSGGASSATVTGLPLGLTFGISGGLLTISGTPPAVSSTTVFSYTVNTLWGNL